MCVNHIILIRLFKTKQSIKYTSNNIIKGLLENLLFQVLE